MSLASMSDELVALKIRNTLWFSELSNKEKEILKDVSKDIISDIKRIGITSKPPNITGFYFMVDREIEEAVEQGLKERGLINESVVSACINSEKTLDSIVKCVKNKTQAEVLPELIGEIMFHRLKVIRAKGQSLDV